MRFIYLFMGLFICNLSFSQLSKKHYDLGLAYLEVHEYNLSIKQFEKSWNRRQETITAEKIIFAYSKLRDYQKASFWQKKVINQLYKEEDKVLMFNVLLAGEEYSMVTKSLKRFREDSNRVWYMRIKQRMDTLKQWEAEQRGRLEEVSSINSVGSEISPVFTKDGLVFASNRELQRIKRKDNATGLPFYDFFIAKGEKEDLQEPSNFSLIINSRGNESSMCFSSDMQDIYFTRIARDKEESANKMKLYLSKKESNIWLKPEVFVLNDSSYAFGQPFLSPDGQLFFFASDMDGGYGGSDLYVSKKIDSLYWTRPINLGNEINTSGNEMNPFFDGNQTIYFSSNGHFSLGGYDLYKSELKGSDWTFPQNLKCPINSSADDLSVFWIDQRHAYISSNRINGTGLEDIYYYTRTK